MEISCIIVDDEPRAHAVLAHYISQLPDISLKGEAFNTAEAYRLLRLQPVDLVFLDINMPQEDGFSLLEMLSVRPMVVITTAYTDHAFRSYEYGAIDYLHKPVRFERFVQAVEKAAKWKQLHQQKREQEIRLKIDGVMRSILLEDIVYIESLGNYCKVVLRGKTYVVLTALKDLEEKLAPSGFVRIHKSYLINLAFMQQIGELNIRVNGIELPIGKTYKRYIAEKAAIFNAHNQPRP